MRRYKLNAPGDFYVTDGECIACTLPVAESPDLIGADENAETGYHCYYKRQPQSHTEVLNAIAAMEVACCGAHRYCGANMEIKAALIQAGLSAQIDE